MALYDDNGDPYWLGDPSTGGGGGSGVSQPGVSGSFTPDAFNQLITDSSSFSVPIDSGERNAIQWLAAKDRILIGTSGGEWRMSGHSNKPLTPTNYDLKPQTVWGSKDMQPLVLHEAVLFVDYVGKKLREMKWDGIDERYQSPDLIMLAEHITKSGGITTMAYQRNPDSIIWATLLNGDLISCTYVKEQDVIAWARHPLEIGEGETDSAELTGVARTTYGDYAQYFVGIFLPIASTKCVANATVENALDTDWGSDGYWNASGASAQCYSAYQLSDKRILVANKPNRVTMISTDGTTDTTWGTNGYYTPSGVAWQPWKILEDDDGNFHVFGGTGAGPRYTYTKLDSDGTFVTGLNNLRLDSFFDAIWSDSTKTRIIAVGGPTVISGVVPNMMAIEPSEGVVDTGWPGNLGVAGYANLGGAGAINYECKLLSDGGFILRQPTANNTLTKFKADGTGKDTSWGDVGSLSLGTSGDAQRVAESDDELYVLVEDASNDAYMVHVDADGVVIDSNTKVTAAGTYHLLQMINGKLFFGTTSASTSNYNIEQWSTSFVYESGFDIAGVSTISFIFPDEDTRARTTTPWTDTTTSGAVKIGANSVTVIPSTNEDEVWISVSRKINDELVRFVERMAPRNWGDDQEDAFFVDSGLTYDGDPATTFSGLDHLEGETVAILGDGAVFPTQTVTNGAVTLEESVSVCQIGLPYTYILKPMRFDQNVNLTSKGAVKKISKAVVSFYKTLNARQGDGTDVRGFDWRRTEPYGSPPELWTGDQDASVDIGFDVEDPFQIEGSDPLPCTVRAIIPDNSVTGG